ncbi:MAG: trigger factor [bacterium]
MKISTKRLPKSQAELTIEVPYDELKPYLLREASKINLAGFRRGKAPYEIVRQQIGETKLLNEALPKIFEETLSEAFSKEKLEVIGEPFIDVEKLEHGVSLIYKARLSLLPEIKLGDYKKIDIKKHEIIIDDGETEKVIAELQDRYAKEAITEKGAQRGDLIMADFNMLIDKVPLEGGQFKNHRILLGAEIFPKEFNENLADIKKGEEKKFEVEYPSNHFDKKLAGKKISFDLKANEVYERIKPDLNDEFAKSLGNFNNLEDLKINIKNIITNDKERNEKEKFEGELLDKLVSQSNFSEIPDILLDGETNKMLHELEMNIISQGGKFEDYLSHIKKTREALKKGFEDKALKRVKTALAIRRVAQIEDIKVGEEEVEDETTSYKSYMSSMSYLSLEIENNLKSREYRNYLKNILLNKKIIEKLAEWAQKN